MSDWLGQTNQKLYQARLLIDASEAESDVVALAKALQEGATFQLMLAYQAYLHELAELAQFRGEILSLQQLIDDCNVPIGEMTELKQLEQDSFSWLSQLMQAFQQCAELNKGAARNGTTFNAIPATAIPMQAEQADNSIRAWFEQLSDLIDCQRTNRQES